MDEPFSLQNNEQKSAISWGVVEHQPEFTSWEFIHDFAPTTGGLPGADPLLQNMQGLTAWDLALGEPGVGRPGE